MLTTFSILITSDFDLFFKNTFYHFTWYCIHLLVYL